MSIVNKARKIRDVIYKYVEIPGRLMRVVDTVEFQTLRRVAQLQMTKMVYPSANHTRFEHSLGACHLGGVALRLLAKNQPELMITAMLIETVQLSLLCHDWGHGAFSHMLDHDVIPSFASSMDTKTFESIKTHEQRSVALLRFTNSKYEFGFSDVQLDLAEAMILGTPLPVYPRWWFQFVSNPDFSLDGDKMDYLVRDSYMIGSPIDLQIDRLLDNMRVINNHTLAFHVKDAEIIVSIFQHRAKMYREVYRHRVNVAFDSLLAPILRDMGKVLKWADLFASKTHEWRHVINDDILYRVPEVAAQFPVEMKHAKELYERFLSRKQPRSTLKC